MQLPLEARFLQAVSAAKTKRGWRALALIYFLDVGAFGAENAPKVSPFLCDIFSLVRREEEGCSLKSRIVLMTAVSAPFEPQYLIRYCELKIQAAAHSLPAGHTGCALRGYVLHASSRYQTVTLPDFATALIHNSKNNCDGYVNLCYNLAESGSHAI